MERGPGSGTITAAAEARRLLSLMNLLFVLHTPRRAVRHRNDKGQRTKDKPQAKQSLQRPSRPLESLVTHPPVP